jgi:hypothetical protein
MQLGDRLIEEGIISEQELALALERQKQHGGRIGQNLIALGIMKEQDLEKFFKRHPTAPTSVESTGLEFSMIADLIMKHILFMGDFRLSEVSDRVKLPIQVVDSVLEVLRRDQFVEVKGGTGYATVTYIFKLTDHGKKRSAELLDVCRYVGPAPVTLEAYQRMVDLQTIKTIEVSEKTVKKAFSHLIVGDRILKRLGPAISSGRTMFVYGPAGNGKTAIAETIGSILPQSVYIPYALSVGGQIITMFDVVNHVPDSTALQDDSIDSRWVLIKRPFVMTGGELTLRMLDLDFNPLAKFYEAPLQMKANNGLFLVDDFGRQQIEPQKLLNRWIVPLDRGVDFMSLHTGMKFCVPFDMLVVFATNIDPKDLVDEAFLRRIRYKIKIDHPSVEEYEAIFKAVCLKYEVEFNKETFCYLLDKCYRPYSVKLNACHPRDIVEQIIDISRYYHQPPVMSKESVDAAWQNYFVELQGLIA